MHSEEYEPEHVIYVSYLTLILYIIHIHAQGTSANAHALAKVGSWNEIGKLVLCSNGYLRN